MDRNFAKTRSPHQKRCFSPVLSAKRQTSHTPVPRVRNSHRLSWPSCPGEWRVRAGAPFRAPIDRSSSMGWIQARRWVVPSGVGCPRSVRPDLGSHRLPSVVIPPIEAERRDLHSHPELRPHPRCVILSAAKSPGDASVTKYRPRFLPSSSPSPPGGFSWRPPRLCGSFPTCHPAQTK